MEKGCDITQLPGYQQGWFAVQDGAAQLAASYLEAKPNDVILDCCAAPGGKTCHILEVEPNLGSITALEVDPLRAKRIEENFTRLGHQGNILVADASQPEEWWNGEKFDRILLDAPCSATGIIRRHPDIKWLRKAKDIEVLAGLQQQILKKVWHLLKPGGTLLYATCSILSEENSQQISDFIANTADANLDPSFNQDSDHQVGLQILPGQQKMDGFYYARLLKSE